jgi:hypothetical protein
MSLEAVRIEERVLSNDSVPVKREREAESKDPKVLNATFIN